MKALMIIILIVSGALTAGHSLASGVKAFQKGHKDFITSGLCVKEKIALGYARDQIKIDVDGGCSVVKGW